MKSFFEINIELTSYNIFKSANHGLQVMIFKHFHDVAGRLKLRSIQRLAADDTADVIFYIITSDKRKCFIYI